MKSEEFATAVFANRFSKRLIYQTTNLPNDQIIMKKETWKFIIQTIIAILTAIATTFGVTSCMSF